MEALLHLFEIPPNSVILSGNHNPWLVALSIVVAVVASYMGLKVSELSGTATSSARRHITLFIGALGLAGGVWSMHFIGMTAFQMCTTVTYGWGITIASFVPSLVASWVALQIISGDTISTKRIVAGGVLVGAGIGAMHYIGMAAMEMAPMLRYNLFIFLLSIGVAIALSALALWIKFALGRRLPTNTATALASMVMGFAISGMHYTGMASARFVQPAGTLIPTSHGEISVTLGLGTGLITLAILSLVIAINYALRYRDLLRLANSSETRIRAMLNTAIDAILTFNRNGLILSANHATTHLLGWQESDILGQSVMDFLPLQYRAELLKQITTHENRFIGKSRDMQVCHKSGSLLNVRVASGIVHLATEELYVVFVSNLTERVQMETSLRENESKFRSLLANIPGIAFRCLNIDGWPMIYISNAVEHITGYKADDFKLPNPRCSFKDLIHPDDLALAVERVEGDGIYYLEYRIIIRSGDVRWMLERGSVVDDPVTGQACLDGFIMDITERKKMEQELIEAKDIAEQAAAARANFTANMSHEIRTPMNAIIGFSDILLESKMEATQHKQISTINGAAKSLLHLLNDILDSAKLDKGKLELDLRSFRLIEEVDMVISTLHMEASKKQVELSTQLAENLAERYIGDPDRLRQILTNLIGNAIKFTAHGWVSVAIAPGANGMIHFVITDSGIGMNDAQIANIFNPYVQADASINRRFGGTGLGTTISRRLAQLMGGDITVESALGKGSCFTVTIPLAESECLESDDESVAEYKIPPLHILIVDDIQQNLDLLTHVLKRYGHTIYAAHDGQQALLRLQSQADIDLVLMDIQMPVMDGLTAARARRDYETAQHLPATPIIALTASVMKNDRLEAAAAGMNGFANKPVDVAQLNQEIARVLGLEHQPKALAPARQNDDQLFDEAKGVKLWGDRQSYYTELQKFLTSFSDKSVEFYRCMDTKDWASMQQAVHALKGVSGNLALLPLMHKLEILERLSHKPNGAQIEAVIADISQQIKLIKPRVETYFDSHAPDRPAVVASKQLRPLLMQALQMVAGSEMSDALLSQISAVNVGIHQAQLELAIAQINDFEFTAAGITLTQLLDLYAED